MDIPVIAIHKYPSPHEVYHQKSYNYTLWLFNIAMV